MSNERKCERCEFWEKIEDRPNTRQLGLCKRNPPTIDLPTSDRDWPHTEPDEWCGEFKNSGSEVSVMDVVVWIFIGVTFTLASTAAIGWLISHLI